MELKEKKCIPCEGGIPSLKPSEINALVSDLNPDWKVIDNHHLVRTFHFVNYDHTMNFVNQVAHIANGENHHPVMHVFFAKVEVEIWTHAIDGLSENDFILAAKIDSL